VDQNVFLVAQRAPSQVSWQLRELPLSGGLSGQLRRASSQRWSLGSSESSPSVVVPGHLRELPLSGGGLLAAQRAPSQRWSLGISESSLSALVFWQLKKSSLSALVVFSQLRELPLSCGVLPHLVLQTGPCCEVSQALRSFQDPGKGDSRIAESEESRDGSVTGLSRCNKEGTFFD
jgi:hypothetical protein